jgi:hypothetical protein
MFVLPPHPRLGEGLFVLHMPVAKEQCDTCKPSTVAGWGGGEGGMGTRNE